MPSIIVVDDLLPFLGKSNIFANYGPNTNSVWAALMEKCWAKINGNYEMIGQRMHGDPMEFFDNVLGLPTKIYAVMGPRGMHDGMDDGMKDGPKGPEGPMKMKIKMAEAAGKKLDIVYYQQN